MDDDRLFPEELTVDILLRLPVVSLFRFKCVCKGWYGIINSPDFIRRWTRPPKILIYYHSPDSPPNPNPITLVSTLDGAQECPDYPHDFRGITRLLGSVDGLFLLERVVEEVYNVQLALCNPATREVRHLPDPNFELPPGLYEKWWPKYGLGLDPMTNDYKVVLFRFLRDRATGHLVDPIYGAVYSCSRDSWRMVYPEIMETFDHWGFGEEICTAHLNGVYYWLMVKLGQISKCYILSFHFGWEVFQVIRGPDAEDTNSVHRTLVLLDGSIAILNPIGFTGSYDLWVMKKAGVWNKLVNFQCFGGPGSIRSWNSTGTVIMISRDNYLVSYDVGTQETRYLGSSRYPSLRTSELRLYGGCWSVCFYKESLVRIRRA